MDENQNLSELDPFCKQFRDFLFLSYMVYLFYPSSSASVLSFSGNSVSLSSSFCVCLIISGISLASLNLYFWILLEQVGIIQCVNRNNPKKNPDRRIPKDQ